MSCDNLKFLYTECIRKIHSQEYSPKMVKECFETWENLIKCVNKDIVIPQINGIKQHTKEDLLYEK